MTHATLRTFAFAVFATAAALSPLLAGTKAEAKGGKDIHFQDYTFKVPMNGYSGFSGAYHCDYQKIPNSVCKTDSNGVERCKVVSWTLRQMCQ
ncbi:MAG TPA: hypothetical protein VJ045_06445 [Hyphomicrobiaceae bacterium]|nr:hypothetical protein [Hyphomicrobiaceae bacterium]